VPSVRTRRKYKLGAHLAKLRIAAKLEQTDVAAQLRKSFATVSKIENGHVLPDFPTLSVLFALYNASDEDRQIAVDLWEVARQDSKRVEHSSGMPPKFRAFLRAEMDAVSERNLEQTVVPGLLQTPAYARALDERGRRFIRNKSDMERDISSRLRRQERLREPNPLMLQAIVDEAAICRLVGGPEVMAGQLRYLLEAMKLHNVTLQVIPFDVGGYGTMSGGAILLEFADEDEPDVVYLEYPRGGEWIENEDDVEKFSDMLKDTAALALPVEESAALIEARIKTLEGR
jgi:transcriptional regulator with XRE-family HTH domain